MVLTHRERISTAEFAAQMDRPLTDERLLAGALEEIAGEVFGDPRDCGKLRPSDRLLADLRLGDDGLALCEVVLAIERRTGHRFPEPPNEEMTLEAFLHSFDPS